MVFAEIVPLLSKLTTFMDRKHLSQTKNIKIVMIWTLLDEVIRQVLQTISVYVELMPASLESSVAGLFRFLKNVYRTPGMDVLRNHG